MKIYVAQYASSFDVDNAADEIDSIPSTICNLLMSFVFIPVIATSHDDALARVIETFANEIRANDDPDEPPTPLPTLDNIERIDNHTYSSDDTTVYSYDVNDFQSRIIVRELTI